MIKPIDTPRLTLRQFEKSDFAAVHSYASCEENVTYMIWGPNSEKETRDFINLAITEANEKPCFNYIYAADQKATGALIGSCNITVSGSQGEIGWILHRDYWQQGYGTEMGNALLQFGFTELGLHRIIAHCFADNHASYRLMEKIGMRREGEFIEGRRAHRQTKRLYSDELSYAVLSDEWEMRREINEYNALPLSFDGFIELPLLDDGVISLVCTAKEPGEERTMLVPTYSFDIYRKGRRVGDLNLRVGYNERMYYTGQIGYNVDKKHRGNGYAGRACMLAARIAKAHGMEKLLINNDQDNLASMRVCEKLGARLVRVARLPQWHGLFKDGLRFVNIYEWDVP